MSTSVTLRVNYEEEHPYEVTILINNLCTLSFEFILKERCLLHCWILDYETNMWIRVPRIGILIVLLTEFHNKSENSISIIFRESKKSPNSSPQLTPTKKTSNSVVEIGSNDVNCIWNLSYADNIIEPFTQMALNMVDMNEIVILQGSTDIFAPKLCVNANSLLCKIRYDAEKGISPYEVTVEAVLTDNTSAKIVLTKQVWTRCLLRSNPMSEEFLNHIIQTLGNLFIFGSKLKELHANKDLFLRLKCFHYDLKHFTTASKDRLELCGGEYYLSNRYFSEQEQSYLLNFPTSSGAIARECLEIVFKSKNLGHEVCSSHDVAPVIEKIYGIRKGFDTEKGFIQYLKQFAKNKNLY